MALAWVSASRTGSPLVSVREWQLASLRASGCVMTGRMGSHTPLCFITWSAVLVGMERAVREMKELIG